VLQFISASSVFGSAMAQQAVYYTSNIANGEHIKLDTQGYSSTSNIVINTTTPYTSAVNVNSLGRVTLNGNKAYLLKCETSCQTMRSAVLSLSWFNADTNTAIGVQKTFSNGNNNINSPGCIAYFAPSVPTRVEVRIVNVRNVSRITSVNVIITQI
jgi:hypothetical protein